MPIIDGKIVKAPLVSDERSQKVSTEIMEQLLYIDKLVFGCLDAKPQDRYIIENGILLWRVIVSRTPSRATRGTIEITLNNADLYDLFVYSTTAFGEPKKMLINQKGLDPLALYYELRAIYL